MTVGVTKAVELGVKSVICASTGNTSASLAAYAARAGLNCTVLIPSGKIAYGKDDEIIHFKPEFEDIKDIAEKTGLSILEINTLTNEKMIKVLKKREC